MSRAAVEIRNLGKSFGGRPALVDVRLEGAEGEMVALIGASGSGKSTLLRHVPGFVAADAGEGRVFGRVMADAAAHRVLRAAIVPGPQESAA
jgi:phosphonate transport system ATP-binding protein